MTSEQDSTRVGRDYSPEVSIYVAEFGVYDDEWPDDTIQRLAFHTLEEAKEWATDRNFLNVDDVEEVGSRSWSAEADMGDWCEIRKVRITQPNRLLRDDRDD